MLSPPAPWHDPGSSQFAGICAQRGKIEQQAPASGGQPSVGASREDGDVQSGASVPRNHHHRSHPPCVRRCGTWRWMHFQVMCAACA